MLYIFISNIIILDISLLEKIKTWILCCLPLKMFGLVCSINAFIRIVQSLVERTAVLSLELSLTYCMNLVQVPRRDLI